jgi:DNA-binding LacI/PurR family transcriptional regulator
VTIRDVANAVGMTTATVSRALSGKGRESARTRDLVTRTANEASPLAQQLRTQTNNTVAIFVQRLDIGVGTMQVDLLQRRIVELGFDVAIHAAGFGRPGVGQPQAAGLASLRRQQPKAMIYMGDANDDSTGELMRYQDQGGVLITNSSPNELGCDNVRFRSEVNTYLAAEHLTNLGHEKIAFCSHGHRPPHGARFEGFLKAMDEAGLPIREDWLLHGGIDGVYARGGAVLAQKVLQMTDRPTAICIVNDDSASSFIQQMLRAGVRVPKDISVVGHDNLLSGEYCIVPLTTVSHATDEIVEALLDMLMSRISGEYSGPSRTRELTGELIIRESTGSPFSA